MAYDNTVPDPDNPGLEDLDAMRENFQLLEDSQVVDEGSTEDGHYIRYENGWQMCISPVLSFDITNEFGAIYQSDTEERVDWNLPIDFISDGFRHISEAYGSNCWSSSYVVNGEIRIVGYSGTSRTDDDVGAIAIGRWK